MERPVHQGFKEKEEDEMKEYRDDINNFFEYITRKHGKDLVLLSTVFLTGIHYAVKYKFTEIDEQIAIDLVSKILARK
jgi:hypothetical protein